MNHVHRTARADRAAGDMTSRSVRRAARRAASYAGTPADYAAAYDGITPVGLRRVRTWLAEHRSLIGALALTGALIGGLAALAGCGLPLTLWSAGVGIIGLAIMARCCG